MMLAIINIPLRSEIVHLYDAIKSGILLLPLMGGIAVGSGLGGAVSVKRNNTSWSLLAAAIFMLVGTVLLSTLADSVVPEAKQWGSQVILGLGLGLNLSSTTFLTSVQVEFEDHGEFYRSISNDKDNS